jgi:hypothetical protein
VASLEGSHSSHREVGEAGGAAVLGGGVYGLVLCPGAVVYGVDPGPAGLKPGVPTAFPPGLVGWPQLGAEKAIAATTAAPVRICLMLSVLRLLLDKTGLLVLS